MNPSIYLHIDSFVSMVDTSSSFDLSHGFMVVGFLVEDSCLAIPPGNYLFSQSLLTYKTETATVKKTSMGVVVNKGKINEDMQKKLK